jgi:hypothetical protein
MVRRIAAGRRVPVVPRDRRDARVEDGVQEMQRVDGERRRREREERQPGALEIEEVLHRVH